MRSVKNLICIVLLTAACTSVETGERVGSVTTDSAGVRVVENYQPAWTQESAWRLDSVPVMRVGEGSEPDSLLLSRAWDLTRLSTGTVAVLEFSKQQILRFAPDGALTGVMGRKGSGPGEFERLRQVFRCANDTVVAVDLTRRVSVWDPHGNFVRQISGPRGSRFAPPTIEGVSWDCGRALIREIDMPPADARVGRPMYRLLWSNWESETMDSVLTFAGIEIEQLPFRDSHILMAIPWSDAPVHAQSRSILLYSDARHPEYRLIDQLGRVRQVVRWSDLARPVDDAERSRFTRMRTAYLKEAGEDADFVPALSDRTIPDAMPMVAEALFDDNDFAWLREYDTRDAISFAAAYDDRPRQWHVFDAEGLYLGRVSVPAALRVDAIADTALVGVWTDTDGIESVRTYRILSRIAERPEQPPPDPQGINTNRRLLRATTPSARVTSSVSV